MAVSLGRLCVLQCLCIHVPLTIACLATHAVCSGWLPPGSRAFVQPGYRSNRDLADNMIQRLAEKHSRHRRHQGLARAGRE